MARQSQQDYGAINHAGGREITIEARHVEWVDWAGRALYAHDDMLAALQSICGVFATQDDVPIYVRKARAALAKATGA